MKNLILILSCISFFSFWSCTYETKKSNVKEEIEIENIIKEISFSFETIKGIDEIGGPLIKIFLNINNEKYEIEEEGIANLKTMMSPSGAMKKGLTSTGGWWAGYGANYAAFQEGNKIIIKKEIVEEIPEEILKDNPKLLIPQIKIIKEIELK